MPFDRLIRALDAWLATRPGRFEVLAQVGESVCAVDHMKTVSTLNPGEFRRKVGEADLIVAHAGMGSVLTAMEFGKPLVVLPRLGALHETRNDHQVATANWLKSKPGIHVAMDVQELAGVLDVVTEEVKEVPAVAPFATPELIRSLKALIVCERV